MLGKRVWLKPGKKYLFGRVKQDGGQFTTFFVVLRHFILIALLIPYLVRHAIENSTISRKHLVIEVERVKPGDGVRLESILPFDSH